MHAGTIAFRRSKVRSSHCVYCGGKIDKYSRSHSECVGIPDGMKMRRAAEGNIN